MTDLSGWRRAYNAVERNAAPRVEALVHTDEFAHMTACVAAVNRYSQVGSSGAGPARRSH